LDYQQLQQLVDFQRPFRLDRSFNLLYILHYTAGGNDMGDYLTRRGGTWFFYRRVPREYAAFDRRKFVFETTKIKVADDRRGVRAAGVADRINTSLVEYWEGLAAGETTAAKARYDDACRRARAMGYRYREATELATDQTDLLSRITELEKIIAKVTAGQPAESLEPTVAAVFGGVKRVTVSMSGLFDAYRKLKEVDRLHSSDLQNEKWTDKRKRAVARFVKVIGDKDISEVTRIDAIAFRKWWADRITGEDLSPSTANSDFSNLSRMFNEVCRSNDLDMPPVFRGIQFEESQVQRVANSIEYIRDKLLAPGAFDRLNPEARRALFVTIETGLRPSELVNLDRSMIRLDAEIPHLRLQNGTRKLKNDNSQRDLPLVGVALAAMQLQPNGFPSYNNDRADLLGDHINAYLKRAGLRETPEHSFYSVRHCFKDRLRDADIETELKDMVMGHSPKTERYGHGFTLARKRGALEKIAFKRFPSNL
jgi:integrase